MPYESFDVGDTVVFKEWDEMVREYGLNRYGNIDCKYLFTVDMKFLCGTEHVIRAINDGHFHFVDTDCGGYHISADMIRPVSEITVDVDIDGFLNLIQE